MAIVTGHLKALSLHLKKYRLLQPLPGNESTSVLHHPFLLSFVLLVCCRWSVGRAFSIIFLGFMAVNVCLFLWVNCIPASWPVVSSCCSSSVQHCCFVSRLVPDSTHKYTVHSAHYHQIKSIWVSSSSVVVVQYMCSNGTLESLANLPVTT